ncbi:MAG: phosphocholine cytidylyltransferase family protein [Treponema sp.]|nr:phosphocholine cytidylyltransferase family protein [Treponema sp.]
MQAIILAAGMGTRIPQYTQDMPKCMIKINEKPILEHTVEALRDCGIYRISIGLGYKAHVIREFIASTFGDDDKLEFSYVENPIYDETNNIYSLYLMKDVFAQDDTLLLESDLIYDKAILRELLALPAENAAVLSAFESWMDGTCCLLDEEGHINGMVGKKDFRYEDTANYYKTVNIWKFSKSFINSIYLPFLSYYISSYGRNEYYETVLKIVAGNIPDALGSLVVSGDRWYEVDDIEDLTVAEKRFAPAADRYKMIMEETGGSWRFPGMADFTVDSNPFFPSQRLFSELRYGLADCISHRPSSSGELDILAAKLLGTDPGQVCVLQEGWPSEELDGFDDASYEDFASLNGQLLENTHFIDLGRRFGVPGLSLKLLFSDSPERLKPFKGKGLVSSLGEYFMQVVGKYKKDYADATVTFKDECVRMKEAVSSIKSVSIKRPAFNRLILSHDLYPSEDDVRKLSVLLLDRYKLLVKNASQDGRGVLDIYVRDRASNDRLISALQSLEKAGEGQ